ncbi:MAG TPA: NADH-quinone oxidoreductase subunit N, partial [Myxococcales bacterium]|nr:NADH-quinone oxidoreductase subunit N [Myxococcales bacterium]
LFGLYYYLRVIVYMYMRPAPQPAAAPVHHWPGEVALLTSALAALWFGILSGPLAAAAQASGMFAG